MRKYLVALYLCIFSSAVSAQILSGKLGDSQSKAVQFMETAGSFIQSDFYYLGHIGDNLMFEAIVNTNIKDGTKIGCVKITRARMNELFIGFLDEDELDAVLQSLEYIKDDVLPNKPTLASKVEYRSRDCVIFGARGFDNSFGNAKFPDKWKLYVYANKEASSIQEINKKYIEVLIGYLKRAQTIIDEKTKE